MWLYEDCWTNQRTTAGVFSVAPPVYVGHYTSRSWLKGWHHIFSFITVLQRICFYSAALWKTLGSWRANRGNIYYLGSIPFIMSLNVGRRTKNVKSVFIPAGIQLVFVRILCWLMPSTWDAQHPRTQLLCLVKLTCLMAASDSMLPLVSPSWTRCPMSASSWQLC